MGFVGFAGFECVLLFGRKVPILRFGGELFMVGWCYFVAGDWLSAGLTLIL